MGTLNAQGKVELMEQAAEIAKAAASSEKAWKIDDYVSLLEKSYLKMVELIQKEVTVN